ncbi:glycosyltransferase 87 family protein [Streptomyces sp. H10-C2]|uniref:glycosyltransferase 87 family protein n=1 Tax=unclassified Streptomyces TaxID=2593676 RepID=UPI0024BB22A0|nr:MULTISPECIES: glycosyltransferase 87 family protein [unclassified Streptomyces]MDJ0340168.1 glycosyltransferase 87 family protein [Streptomyces sp. PH10-H1]MDJ0369195.1 glycosyltransferase 87 family protein [Streptomyces sp. H10-C2]
MTATQLTADTRILAARTFILRRPTLLAAAFCLVSFAAFWAAQRASHVSMIDLMVYRAEGATARSGGDLYDMRATYANLPTTYPPFAALVFMPLTWIGVGGMRAAATVVNLGLLVALVHLSLRLTGRPLKLPTAAVTLALASLAVWCEPVWTTLRYGQINLLLAVLVLWDLTRRADHRWAGFGIGIAAGIKLTPALFAVFLALAGAALGWRRLRRGHSPWNVHLRRAAVAVVTFIGTVAMAAVALPHDSRRFWTEMLFAADRVGFSEDTANQSLRGIFARALHTGDPGYGWLLAAAVVGSAGLAIAVAALLAGDRFPHSPAWATLACAVTALLVSPVSWSHHWVWGVPMVVLLGTEALRRRDAVWGAGAALTGLAFCSFLLWMVPHGTGRFELGQNTGQMALSAIYPAVGAAFLAVAGTLAFQAFRARPPGRRPAPAPAMRARRPAAYDYVNR